MKFEDCKLMALGGNCASMYILGGDIRIRGPVDNVVIEKVDVIKLLFENRYLEAIKKFNCTQIATPHPKINEPRFSSQFDFGVTIIHNDPKTDHYYETLALRINTFNNFYKEIHNPSHYFIFVLNQRTTYYGTKQLRGTLLIDILEYLKKLNLINKVIFVGTNEANTVQDTWTYYNYSLNNNDLKQFKEKYNIKYIELTELDLTTDEGKMKAHQQFKQQLLSL